MLNTRNYYLLKMFKHCAKLIQLRCTGTGITCKKSSHCQIRAHRRLAIPNLKLSHLAYKKSWLHTSSCSKIKRFIDTENTFAYNVLQALPVADINLESVSAQCDVTTEEDFNSYLDQNWRTVQASEIPLAFRNVLNYCTVNNVNVSDKRFDKLVDGLMDNVEKLSIEELAAVLNCLSKYPPTDSFKSHNYHDVWSALDDITCLKMRDWDVDTMFMFADLWYRLNLGRICDYIVRMVLKLGKKAGKLTKTQLVRAFFFVNVCRKRDIDFEYENALQSKIHEMSVDEMAIVAMGFFKSQSKIKITHTLHHMINQVTKECETVHEISLAAILKIIRFSSPTQLSDQIESLLDHLTPQISRLSHLCCLHIALLGTNLQICHEASLAAASQKLVRDVHDINAVRLKDVERLLLALTMFDFDPQTNPDAFETMRNELHRPERLPEKLKYQRCIGSALSYLSIRNIYSYELTNQILDKEFITKTYGNSTKHVARDLFSLDLCTEIECPDYKGNRLDLKARYKAAKWLTEFVPKHDQSRKLTAADNLILDVIDTMALVTGDKKYLFVGHVLPHFSKPDVVICVDRKTKKYIEPAGFDHYILGDVMRPSSSDDHKWYAVVIVTWNLTMRNSTRTLGTINMKTRQLKAVGYEPILVIWSEYLPLQKEEKTDYILSKMRQL